MTSFNPNCVLRGPRSRHSHTGSWGISVNVGGDDFVHSIMHTGGPLRPEGVLGVLSNDGVVTLRVSDCLVFFFVRLQKLSGAIP